MSSTNSQMLAQFSSYERRKEEWQFQQGLSRQDIGIANQQVNIAEDRVRVVGQERQIAQMQNENAEATVDFLTNKFTNAQLYDWMSNILERVYAFFLQQATANAKAALHQLAFERQETPPSYIRNDYWAAPSDSIGSAIGIGDSENAGSSDRRGLTGSVRLLQDIYQLDQYALDTDKRKLQLTKTISLSNMTGMAFQQFKETGQLPFALSMEMFDRDFPGHYLRLIKRVKVTVIALVPPVEGIKATLQNMGISYTVISGNGFQRVPIPRDPEMIAFTSPNGATGLFELEQVQTQKLYPFESTGVESKWLFELPPASNALDFNTIADVLITFEYTALNSNDYRAQVIGTFDSEVSLQRTFSFKDQFTDQWYDLANEEPVSGKLSLDFQIRRDDFPSNLRNLEIEQVGLYFVRSPQIDPDSFDGEDKIERISEVEVSALSYTPKDGGTVSATGVAKATGAILSTRQSGVASNWAPLIGKPINGDWSLKLDNSTDLKALFADGDIADIILVITYSGETPKFER